MGILAGLLRRKKLYGHTLYLIKRAKGGKKRDGCWFVDADRTDIPNPRLYLSCPWCGHLSDISDYEVHQNGAAYPCVVCRKGQGGCGRNFYILLEGWDFGHRKENIYW